MIRVSISVFLLLVFISGCQSSAHKTNSPIEIKPAKNKQNEFAAHTTRLEEKVVNLTLIKPVFPRVETLSRKPKKYITLLLGQPDFRRIDKPAELWQYRHESCRIDMFFYPKKSGVLVLGFLDARTPGNKNMNNQECFDKIATANTNKGNAR